MSDPSQAERKCRAGLSIGSFLKIITVVYVAVSIALSVLHGLSAEPAPIADVLHTGAPLCGLALLVANLLFALCSRCKRGHYLSLVVCVILAWTFDWNANGRHVSRRRQNFIQSGRL